MIDKLNIYYVGKDYLLFKDEVIDSTFQECVEYVKKQKELCVDIETTPKEKYWDHPEAGLDPYLSNIVMVQIGTIERQYVIDWRTLSEIKKSYLIERIIFDRNRRIVGQNLKFEIKHLLKDWLRGKPDSFMKHYIETDFYDTMLAEQIITNGYQISASLDAMSQRYLNFKLPKDIRANFATVGSRAFTISELTYGALDIYIPLLIKKEQGDRIKKYTLQNCIKLEMRFLPVLAVIELEGMPFDIVQWKELYQLNERELEKQLDELNNFVLKDLAIHYKFIDNQLDLFSTEKKCRINWNSPMQVIEFLKHLGICPKAKSKTTGKISYTVDAKALKSTLQKGKKVSRHPNDVLNHMFLETYIKYKEISKLCSTYGLDFLKYVNPVTKKIHSNYRQIVSTGRISSSNPNLQNIPSDIMFRRCFNTEYQGMRGSKTMLTADYSGQEQIILVNKSREPKLIEFYESGEADMHSYIAKQIFPSLKKASLADIKSNFPEFRTLAKGAGFAINYGGNGKTISENLGISLDVGQTTYENYFKAFPKLAEYFKKVQTTSLNRGYITMDKITERKYFFTKTETLEKKKRLALNYPIQGEAGSITKTAVILYYNKMKAGYYMNPIINLVHDEINVLARKSEAVIVKSILCGVMEEAANFWCKIIPMKVGAEINDYWTH